MNIVLILVIISALIFGLVSMYYLVAAMKIKYYLSWPNDWELISGLYLISFTPLILGLILCGIELYGEIERLF